MSHNDVPEAVSTVRMPPNGDIDTALSSSDVCKMLGLNGDGIGQLVGVRSPNVISAIGVACIPKSIKIVSFNPPEVIISVEGVMTEDGDQRIIAT